jgi:hypothetical protein
VHTAYLSWGPEDPHCDASVLYQLGCLDLFSYWSCDFGFFNTIFEALSAFRFRTHQPEQPDSAIT